MMNISKLELLIEQYQNQLVRFVSYRINAYEDAVDIVQNVFINCFEKDIVSRDIDNYKSFLFSSAYNASVDYNRKKKLDTVSLEDNYREPESKDRSALELNEELKRINTILNILPENQSEVVRMRVIDEIPFNEIALIMDIPVATAKSRYKYGMEKLKMSYKLKEMEVKHEL